MGQSPVLVSLLTRVLYWPEVKARLLLPQTWYSELTQWWLGVVGGSALPRCSGTLAPVSGCCHILYTWPSFREDRETEWVERHDCSQNPQPASAVWHLFTTPTLPQPQPEGQAVGGTA